MSVVQLHKPHAVNDVTATLRRIADQIEAGEHGDWPVTTCVVLLGHTDGEVPQGEALVQQTYWSTYGAGPRTDIFTVRGLLASAINRWGHDHQ